MARLEESKRIRITLLSSWRCRFGAAPEDMSGWMYVWAASWRSPSREIYLAHRLKAEGQFSFLAMKGDRGKIEESAYRESLTGFEVLQIRDLGYT